MITISASLRLTPPTHQLLTQFGDILQDGVTTGMQLTTEATLTTVVEATPVGSGGLRASEYGRVVTQWPLVTGVVGTPLVYGAPMEMGTRPYWPPQAPLEGWVRRKFGYTGRQMVEVAFLIRRAISRRGVPKTPYGMFQRGLQTANRVGPRFIEAAVLRVTQMLSDR